MKRKHSPISDDLAARLRLMLEVTSNMSMLASILDVARIGVRAPHLHYLVGPVSYHTSPWVLDVPAWVLQAALVERLDLVIEEHNEQVVGELAADAECLYAMYPASMEAPMTDEASRVYFHLGARVMQRHKGQDPRVFFTAISVSDWCRPMTLTEHEERYVLNRLKADIRRRVVRDGRSKWRSMKSPKPGVNERRLTNV